MITITPTPQQFSVPPPVVVSAPNINVPPPGHRFQPPQRFHGPGRHQFFQPFRPYNRNVAALDPEFDGKRLRKSAMRKTVDYNAAIIKMLEGRVWQRDFRDRRALQPDSTYIPDLLPPPSYEENPINAVTTRFVKTATNKMRCPVFCMAWTPEGRRLVTGASSGEFTLWNGLTFNFETILQAHDSPVRTMVWSHNDIWMVTADHSGYVKYWQSNMNSVKVFMAHKEAIRGISFSPSDSKFATCSDDGTIRIWDFLRCQEERILRGHGADVKCVHWHPQKGLVVSGSKDNQQPVKLWDPKTGQSLATLHAHKSTVMDIKWNKNGNWLVTASRDHLLKLFDIRNLSSEVQTFRGHKKESSSVAWHPHHEGLFCSGGSDGAILFWHVGADKEVGAIEQAHDSIVWTLAWHPLGHILCSGSNDHTSKFWTRNRPGDQMRDKYNLNTLPASLAGLDENDLDDYSAIIPGMGPEDKVEVVTVQDDATAAVTPTAGITPSTIPGLDIDPNEEKVKAAPKKVPYSKPIPKNFQAHWNETRKDDNSDESKEKESSSLINSIIEQIPGVIPLAEIKPEALLIYGKMLQVKAGTPLASAISGGADKLYSYVNSGVIPELRGVMPYYDISDDENKNQISDNDDEDDDDIENIDYYGDTDDRISGFLAGFKDTDERIMNNSNQDFNTNNSWNDSDERFQGGVKNQGATRMPPPLPPPDGGPMPLMGFQAGPPGDGGGGGFMQSNSFMPPPDMFGGPFGMDNDMRMGGGKGGPNMNQQGVGSGSGMNNEFGGGQNSFNRFNSNDNKPPPLLPPEEVERFRTEMNRKKEERSNRSRKGGGVIGGAGVGVNRNFNKINRRGMGKFNNKGRRSQDNRSFGGGNNRMDYNDDMMDDGDDAMDDDQYNDGGRNWKDDQYGDEGSSPSRRDTNWNNDSDEGDNCWEDDSYEEGQIDDYSEMNDSGNRNNDFGGRGGGGISRFGSDGGRNSNRFGHEGGGPGKKKKIKNKKGFERPWSKGSSRGRGGAGLRGSMKRGGGGSGGARTNRGRGGPGRRGSRGGGGGGRRDNN